jgi:uncharacterized membrane protein YcaP (DUF421 family)
VLIANRRLQRRNMRQELITEDEIMSQLRQHGIESVEDVRRAYGESDGQISVIKSSSKNDADQTSGKQKKQQT